MNNIEVVEALYRGLLGRPSDPAGLEAHVTELSRGTPLAELIAGFTGSPEFRVRHGLPSVPLPDLTKLYPENYTRQGDDTVFHVGEDADFTRLEYLIRKHRYYDSFGVWTPTIDLDKRVTAAIVGALGASTVFEMGCFTGAVLSLLADRGIDVHGAEISHLAHLLAFANVRDRIYFGDIFSYESDRPVDVFLAMDVLEHLNPLDLGKHVERSAKMTSKTGFVLVNSPMFGTDDIFGTVFDKYLPEWIDEGPWRQIHCDAKGWPMHGHLVWASPAWWERQFFEHGLERDREIERAIHRILGPFFDKGGPARRSFFLLRHAGFQPDVAAISNTLESGLAELVKEVA